MSQPDLDLDLCRGRQRRLLDEMHAQELDLAIVTRIEHVQWLTGVRANWYFEPAAALTAAGHCTLVAPHKPPATAAADSIIGYEAKWHSTLRNDQRHESSAVLLRALGKKARRAGVEFSVCGPALAGAADELADIDPVLYRLRRRKDADELAMINKAIAGTAAMYALAREIVRPGINELDVFSQLQGAAVREFGEPTTQTGNDYACAARGGPPGDRTAQPGELYILDLGPAYRGYFSDNCRTLAVDRKPSDAQQRAWEEIVKVFPYIESTVAPGVSCRQVFQHVQEMMDRHLPGSFNHHLGHGIGLNPHEGPHVNPNWDDTFEEGDVFTIEPGLYSPELRAGIRLENDYLVTKSGVQLLSDFPLEL